MKVLVGLTNSTLLARALYLHQREEKAALIETTMRFSRFSILFSLAIFLPTMVLAHPIIEIWLGPSQANESGFLLLLVAAQTLVSVVPSSLDTACAVEPRAVKLMTKIQILEASAIAVAGYISLRLGIAEFLISMIAISAIGGAARRRLVSPLLGISPDVWFSMLMKRALPIGIASCLGAALLATVPCGPVVSIVAITLLISGASIVTLPLTLPFDEWNELRSTFERILQSALLKANLARSA